MLTLYITDSQLTLITPKQSVFYLPFASFDSDLCAESLMSYVKENCLMVNTVVLAISMEHVLFREVVWDMEFSDWQVYQSIRRNFDHYFPGALSEEFWIDFEVMNLKDGNLESQLKLQIYAVSKRLLQSYITLMESVGLKVRTIDVDVLTLGKVFSGLGLNHIADVPKLSDQFKVGMIVEGNFIWFIECSDQRIVRLKKTIFISKQPDDFVSSFQAFLSENLWDISKIFYIGGSENLFNLLDVLKDRFNVTTYPIDLLKQFNFLLDLTDVHFIKKHPLSSLVHFGLREHYGN